MTRGSFRGLIKVELNPEERRKFADVLSLTLWGRMWAPVPFKGTIAEELHHVCRFLRQGDEKQIFKFNWEDGNDGVLLYYTLNPPELEALRFVVEVTGDRANLLKEVEGYLERRVGSTVRILQ